MNRDVIEGNWTQLKGKVREMWGKLTDDDVDVIQGKRKQLSGKLQERYGLAKDEAEDQIDEFLTRHQLVDREQRRTGREADID